MKCSQQFCFYAYNYVTKVCKYDSESGEKKGLERTEVEGATRGKKKIKKKEEKERETE